MSTRGTPEAVGDLPKIGRPATSALLSVGVASLLQVSAMSRQELLAIHGVGPKALRILEEALAERGMGFKLIEPTG